MNAEARLERLRIRYLMAVDGCTRDKNTNVHYVAKKLSEMILDALDDGYHYPTRTITKWIEEDRKREGQ